MSTSHLHPSLELLVFLLLVQVSGTAAASSQDLKIVGTQTLCFDDGRTIERFLVRDLATGEVFAKTAAEIPRLIQQTFPALADSAGGGLTPWPTRRLPRELETLDFHLNTYADEHRAYFNQITKELINPLRPVKQHKPRLRIKKKVIDPIIREGATYYEFMDDGVNMIYTHPEDLGLPEELVGIAVGMATSYWDFETYTYRGGDVALSAASLQGDSYEGMVRRFIHEFGHIYGYYHTGWIEDVMSYVCPWVRMEYYWDPTSFIWDMGWLKDKMIYGGKRGVDGNYRSAVELMPPTNAVIDMEYLKVEAPDPNLGRHVLFSTILKGYRDRPMTLTLYRGTKADKSKKIVSISGYHPNFDDPSFAGLLENYNTSVLYFTRQKDFKKLKKAVKRRGKPGNFHDVRYSHVLRVTAVIEGYRGPNDPELVTQTRTVRFAYRAEGEWW